jgi:hypothetical protein
MKKTLILVAMLISLSAPLQAQVVSVHRSHWFNSKKFWSAFAMSQGAAEFDYSESQRAFNRGAREGNPMFFSARPTMAQMNLIGLPISFVSAYSSYKLSQSDGRMRKTWFLPAAANVGMHIFGGVHDSGICRPSCGGAQ